MPKYQLTEHQKQQLTNHFTYHAPKGDQAQRYELIRDSAHVLAQIFLEETPESEEQAQALKLLRLAVMSANQAIALNE